MIYEYKPEVRVISISKAIPEEMTDFTPDEFIAYCARVSNPANQMNTKTSEKLLKYCAKNHHWSVFEMAHVIMEVKTTRDISHQVLRHRSFSFQEFSQRYAKADEFVVCEMRLQDNKNRQNSIQSDDDYLKQISTAIQEEVINFCAERYNKLLDLGVAKECARKVLPEGLTQTTLYMSGLVRNWIHYCMVRCEKSTQLEHRLVADACWNLLVEYFPALKDIKEQD